MAEPKMTIEPKLLFHPRILDHCAKLYMDGHYKHAAFEAMNQVELAIKERIGAQWLSKLSEMHHVKPFGVGLIKALLGTRKGLPKLRIPFGPEMQEQAKDLFVGAFVYYRNYAAHDGTQINDRCCLRVMVLASDLLDLIGASVLSFADIGGSSGLVRMGVFSDASSVSELLLLVDGKTLLDDQVDGFDEMLWSKGYTLAQVYALIDVGLVEYRSREYIPPSAEELRLLSESAKLEMMYEGPDTVGWFELTDLGKKVIADASRAPAL